jgi:signal transduction histidine kinase
MRERTRLIGGTIAIEAARGRGTSVVVTVPVSDRADLTGSV